MVQNMDVQQIPFNVLDHTSPPAVLNLKQKVGKVGKLCLGAKCPIRPELIPISVA